MNRWQDINISDASLKAEFIARFFNMDFANAFAIISNNPQLDTKAFLENVLNEIANILSLLENDYQNEVINYLVSQISNFQNVIDNYKMKGSWDSTTTYQIYNFVVYNNIDYLYINETPSSGNLPTNTNYWLELDLQGEKGGGGINVKLQYNWDATVPYNILDIVYYNNALWVAKTANINVAPSNGAIWETFLNFKLIKIYSNQNTPTGDDLYNGVIWFEILNS